MGPQLSTRPDMAGSTSSIPRAGAHVHCILQPYTHAATFTSGAPWPSVHQLAGYTFVPGRVI